MLLLTSLLLLPLASTNASKSMQEAVLKKSSFCSRSSSKSSSGCSFCCCCFVNSSLIRHFIREQSKSICIAVLLLWSSFVFKEKQWETSERISRLTKGFYLISLALFHSRPPPIYCQESPKARLLFARSKVTNAIGRKRKMNGCQLLKVAVNDGGGDDDDGGAALTELLSCLVVVVVVALMAANS